jgi:hypothetical protein
VPRRDCWPPAPDIFQDFEFTDDLCRDCRGALAGMRMGAVGTFGAHGKLEPQWALFAKAQCPRAARLAAQAAVAEHFRVMLGQVAGTVGSERLFVRYRRQGQPAVELGKQFAHIQKREDGGRGAAFHVARAASVDAAVDEFPAPRVMCPAGAIAHREHVDMAVECEVTAGFAGLKRRDDVRHDLVGRDHTAVRLVAGQELTDMSCRLAGVAGRVRARTTDEAPEEIEQDLAVPLNPLQQLRLATFHSSSPVALPVKQQFMGKL